MPKREPLYPHVPKGKQPIWRDRERAILQDTEDLRTDDLSNVYVVELTRNAYPDEILVTVQVKDILSSTDNTIHTGTIMAVNKYALFRDFKEFTWDGTRPARVQWLKLKGIDPQATPYHYRPWEAGNMAFYIDDLKNLVCGVEIKRVNTLCWVELIEVMSGRASAGDLLSVSTSSLYESFRDYAVRNPDKIDWLLGLHLTEQEGGYEIE